jgi:beta-galactosidase
MKGEQSLMSEIASTPHQAQIAFLLDYDSLWALQLQPHHPDFNYMRQLFVYYRALQRLGLPADIVSADADLGSYRLVILPTAFVATQLLARSLKTFAEAGGTVMLGVRSGFKTTSNQVTDQPLPGDFRELVGITVNDWHSLPPGIGYGLSSNIPGLDGAATVWAEALNPATTESQFSVPNLRSLVHYTTGPFSSSAALVEHKLGAGQSYYLGWCPTDVQAEALLAYLASQAGVMPLARLPEGLIVAQRGNHLILLNFTDEPLTANIQGKAILVEPRDVHIFETPE